MEVIEVKDEVRKKILKFTRKIERSELLVEYGEMYYSLESKLAVQWMSVERVLER